MAVKIRLARHGRKRYAYYHIVIADSRAPRDGRYIERIGSYNPNTNPATINLNFDKALTWLGNGAQPTETCRAILSYKGVLMKKHLLEGVKKGAFDLAQAEVRFNAWLAAKEGKVQAKVESLSGAKVTADKDRLEAELKVNANRVQAIAARKAELEAIAKAAAEETVADEATEEATEETQGE